MLDANDAYWELTGYNPKTSIGHDYIELDLWEGHPEQREELVKDIQERNSLYNPDFVFSDTNGNQKSAICFYELIHIGEEPCILSMLYDVSAQKQAEERLRELTRRLVTAQEEERKRIAQELHDELGQALTAISLDLGSIEKALSSGTPSGIKEHITDARSLADEVDERISEIALDLRPSLLDDLGLLPTLQWYLNRYSQRLGIEVSLDVQDLEDRLPEEVETTLYRVIQEALTNIAKHAKANTVRLNLERSKDAIGVTIRDDGRGFDVKESQESLTTLEGVGLIGIRDRVSTLGGRAEIHSKPGQGTSIEIEIPL